MGKRLVLISDTHRQHKSITLPEGDILIHAGDFTNSGTLKEIVEFNDWLGTLDYSIIICVAGNHDRMFERARETAEFTLSNATYLRDSSVTIDGVKFYGSPWQPEFGWDWAFNLPRGDKLAQKWAEIPEDTDVLITHGPPYGIGDEAARFEYMPKGSLGERRIRQPKGEHVGCKELLKRIEVVKPKLHVCGHIHEAWGKIERDGTIFVNASCCTLDYKPTNKPIIVEI